MEILTLLSIFSRTSSILGYSIKDLIKKPTPQSGDLIKILSVFEKNEDPLVGIWEISQWKYDYEARAHPYVSGHMAILYRDPSDNIWKGAIYLRYQKELSSKRWMPRY